MARQIEAQFRDAALALQKGDARAARRGFLKITRKLPDSVAAWCNLGLSHQYLGDHERAISAYRKALQLDPRNTDTWVSLGLSQKHCGDLESARASVDKAFALEPGHPRVLNLLGTLEAEQGHQEAALRHFKRCLELQPDNADAAVNLANLYLRTGDIQGADGIASKLLARMPGDRRTRLLKAGISVKRKAFDEAMSIITELRKDAEDEDVLRADLSLREAVRDHFGVIDVAGKLLESFPDDAGLWNSLGSAYFQLDSIEKAKTYYLKAIELEPDNSEHQNNLGLVYSSVGDRASADRHYRRALELNPGNAEAYRNIAAMKRYESPVDPDITAVEKLWSQTAEDDPRRIQLAFALGKMYDDCGDSEKAFSTYKIGNDLKFQESPVDLDKYFGHMDRIASVLSERPRAHADPVEGPQPIFILGMPRSGTTLVEQIVSRHPDVLGCGELPCIERAIMRLERLATPMRVYPDDFPSIGSEELNVQARKYTEWVGQLHALEQPFHTDKMPFNFVHVWLIKALFPAAPIVHCRRHPLDVIVSNYFQLYGSDISFVYNLKALARYTVRYFRLTRHWKELFGDDITDVTYEVLVNDSERETRRLIDAVGLPWSDSCLDQNRSAAPVRTASIWQVRRGIYGSSRERWRKYERHLGDAIEVLVGEGILDGETLAPAVDSCRPV